ncbi:MULTISPECIES: excalibur calcium-binding domain-containing protein [Micromonospora]|uniref:excalibur calcium-binding domain-containing protein n=1 Tax=Micromonospora TaxID=1873 RepID=UPI00234B34EE|nr:MULTISPECIES: excalibur calcium-binding domain-containing protein [Micromonospora]WCN83849.1 excalibur calcium-binding domain-containing protein [Micromonospora sp. LH3U1]
MQRLAPSQAVTGKKLGRKGWIGLASVVLLLCCCGAGVVSLIENDDPPGVPKSQKTEASPSAAPSLNGRQLAERDYVAEAAVIWPGVGQDELLALGKVTCEKLVGTGGDAGALAAAVPAAERARTTETMLVASKYLCKPQHSSVVSWKTFDEAQSASPSTKPRPTAPRTTAPTKPKPAPKNDPRYGTCAEANDHGLGPYRDGSDPEYDWYQDRDRDGIVCEQ